jgi:hypothetical protein
MKKLNSQQNKLLSKIKTFWQANPELRFGQMINYLSCQIDRELWLLGDGDLLKIIEYLEKE